MLAFVVDDSRAMRSIMKGLLKDLGYDTIDAVDGKDALQQRGPIEAVPGWHERRTRRRWRGVVGDASSWRRILCCQAGPLTSAGNDARRIGSGNNVGSGCGCAEAWSSAASSPSTSRTRR